MNRTPRFPTGCRVGEQGELVSVAKPCFCEAVQAGGQEAHKRVANSPC